MEPPGPFVEPLEKRSSWNFLGLCGITLCGTSVFMQQPPRVFVKHLGTLWKLLGPVWNLLGPRSNFLACLEGCLWNLPGCFCKTLTKAFECEPFAQNFKKRKTNRISEFYFLKARFVQEVYLHIEIDYSIYNSMDFQKYWQ